MRIWSIHPKYLDSKGLVALWRETLLAKNVIEGRTKGYKYHPQLIRFRKTKNALGSISQYLKGVYQESVERGYNFDKSKMNWAFEPTKLTVTKGQLDYEIAHLLKKLKIRDTNWHNKLENIRQFETHPMFFVVDGGIEAWEKTDTLPHKFKV